MHFSARKMNEKTWWIHNIFLAFFEACFSDVFLMLVTLSLVIEECTVLHHIVSPETHHWSTPQKMLKKSCVFTKFFHSFFSQKNTLIIYILFNFYFSEKSLLFLIKKLIKSELKWLIFISFLYKIKLKYFHCFYTHKNDI